MNMPEYISKKKKKKKVLKVYSNGFLSNPLIQFSII